MNAATSDLVTDSLARAVSVVYDFAPLFALAVGLAVAMWVGVFLRTMFTGE